MTDSITDGNNPVVTYTNTTAPTHPPSKQLYHLRKLNWMFPYSVPANHKVVVFINDNEIEDFHFYNSVVTLKNQPMDGDKITITTELIPENNEDNDSTNG